MELKNLGKFFIFLVIIQEPNKDFHKFSHLRSLFFLIFLSKSYILKKKKKKIFIFMNNYFFLFSIKKEVYPRFVFISLYLKKK
jgi:hypothetical protein